MYFTIFPDYYKVYAENILAMAAPVCTVTIPFIHKIQLTIPILEISHGHKEPYL